MIFTCTHCAVLLISNYNILIIISDIFILVVFIIYWLCLIIELTIFNAKLSKNRFYLILNFIIAAYVKERFYFFKKESLLSMFSN